MQLRRIMYACGFALALGAANASAQQPLKRNPTPQDYIERNGGGATIVPAGQLVLGGHRMSCGSWATIFDPSLNDYAASYPQFIILNMQYVATAPTAVKLWIYTHECGHLLGGPDENNADCFAVRRGRNDGWLGLRALDEICTFISSARADSAHSDGLERCNLMRKCYQQTTPKTGPKVLNNGS